MTNEQQEMVLALTQHREPMPTYTEAESAFLKRWLNGDPEQIMSAKAARELDQIYLAYRPPLEHTQ